MAMNSNGIDNVFYSQNNLDNTYSQVSDEILRRTNKDISKNSNYKATFNKMAPMVYDKIPPNDRNLMKCNTTLVDKCVTYFHAKIFEKTVQSNRPQASNSVQNAGFTMIKDNEDLDNKMNELMASRQSLGTMATMRGDGNPNSYLPQPVLSPQQVQQPQITSTHGQQFNRVGDTMAPTNKGSIQNIDFTIQPFNLNDDLTESLLDSDTKDMPLYQNIESLQKMNGMNPMSMLEDYTKQRNLQAQQYIDVEKRQNITAMRTSQPQQSQLNPQIYNNNGNNNMVYDRNNTDAITKIDQTQVDPMELFKLGNELTERYVDRMEERIVNDNNVQTISPENVQLNQDKLVKMQRDTQPKYIEKVHYININSVDRNWFAGTNETRYDFQVKFNQNQDYVGGATISNMYRNIISVELVSAVMPMDAYIEPFDTRIYMGLSRYPYLLLRIEELDNVFKGTNNWVDKAFSTMIFDKVFYTNTLSTDYISGTGTSIVNSTPKQGFAGEYLRGFMKYNPAYFEKKKYYNNPLANLSRMTIDITDPRGNSVNTQKDVLDISEIAYTANVAVLTGTELIPTYSFPRSTQNVYSMIKITTTTYFSNRLFRIGDRIIINNFAFNGSNTGSNDSRFLNFINRPEGHIILNLDLETSGAANTTNRGFINNIYIAPPGTMDATNNTVDPATYYDNTGTVTVDFGNVSNWGRLIDVDLQTQLLFRIVTRDPDTSNTLTPINVY
jgi:hypothetical protein